MRILDGEQVLVRIFIGESDRWHHRPLTDALLERLRKEGFAGATVFQGIAGFGARSVLHTTHLLRLSEDLPVVKAAFDEFERVLGILSLRRTEDAEPPVAVEEIERLIEERHAARRRRAFSAADRIRDDLAARGVLLEDSAAGTRWKRK